MPRINVTRVPKQKSLVEQLEMLATCSLMRTNIECSLNTFKRAHDEYLQQVHYGKLSETTITMNNEVIEKCEIHLQKIMKLENEVKAAIETFKISCQST